MRIIKGPRGVIPLVVFEDEKVLCFRFGWIGVLEKGSDKFKRLALLENDLLRRILSFWSITARYFGLNEIKAAITNDDCIFISYHHLFFLYQIKNGDLSQVRFDFKDSSRACLYLKSIKDGVIWGEYGYNPQKKRKSVFYYNHQRGEIVKLYTFGDSQINHIHNIIVDSNTSRIWILTGDFDNSAAIFYTDDFFKTVHCQVSGSQLYRGCIGYSKDNILYYATDSPDETNYIIKNKDGVITKLFELNGSCIYGVICNGEMFFSTTVENEANQLNNGKNNFKYNRGRGIKDWYAYLYSFNIKSEQITTILKSRKDIFPMLAFKYGCFRFPSINNSSGVVFSWGQALRKYDNHIIRIILK